MVFSSHAFLLGFLPIVYLLFLVFRRQSNRLGVMYLLIAASLVFYAWWNPSYLALILGSIFVNYLLGRVLGQSGMPNSRTGRSVLAGGIVLNLGTIAYYKYAGFFAATYSKLSRPSLLRLVEPVGPTGRRSVGFLRPQQRDAG